MNKHQLHILQHSIGLDDHGRDSKDALCPPKNLRSDRMTDRHFQFSDEMGRRILSGEKTQTRRPLLDAHRGTPPTGAALEKYHWSVPAACFTAPSCEPGTHWSARLPAAPGDVLIGRECHRVSGGITSVRVDYRADGGRRIVERETEQVGGALVHYLPDVSKMERPRGQWRPSIHMPRWAARIVRPITGVRVERVQEISEADAVAEGFCRDEAGRFPTPHEMLTTGAHNARQSFRLAWNTIYAAKGLGWDTNPWVWRIEFGAENVKATP